ncbi:AEC family transporter [Caulobacter soli]|uniref:AEC family transporter n=1 Tax=Caulobacter soli TaxID=2708539 RepID=UPI0013ED6933|nr:AEC family transporter [Caulobacter soli]
MTHLLLDVPQRVVPFFLLVAAGVSLARLRLFDARMSAGLSSYVYWIGFPALLVHSLSHVGAPDRALALGLTAYGACALLVVALMAAVGAALRWTREERAGGSLSASLGNSAFLGLPIAAAVLGPEAARLSAGAVAVDFVVVAAVGVGLLGWAGGRSTWRSLMQALRNPIVLAAMTGSAMALLGLSLPGVLDRAVEAAAASGSPVALVALGVALGLTGLPAAGVPCEPTEEPPPPIPRWTPIIVAAVCKLLVLPVLVWFATGLIDAPLAFRLGATLLAATPTAVNVFIQTKAYSVFERGGARIVALTTAVSCISLSAVAILLEQYAAS